MKFGTGECGLCKESYEKVSHKQIFCSNLCRDKHKGQENVRKWVERKPRPPVDPTLAARLKGACCYGGTNRWDVKFTACRG